MIYNTFKGATRKNKTVIEQILHLLSASTVKSTALRMFKAWKNNLENVLQVLKVVVLSVEKCYLGILYYYAKW